MAAWRRKLDRLLPDLEGEPDPPTPYGAFFALLDFVRDAHQREDVEALRRAYGFAQWCHHQRAGSDLPDAAAVAFYEHLFDYWSLRHSVIPWLAPEIRRGIAPLWSARLEAGRFAELEKLLQRDLAGGPWQELRAVGAKT
jgi:hypothetical protein